MYVENNAHLEYGYSRIGIYSLFEKLHTNDV